MNALLVRRSVKLPVVLLFFMGLWGSSGCSSLSLDTGSLGTGSGEEKSQEIVGSPKIVKLLFHELLGSSLPSVKDVPGRKRHEYFQRRVLDELEKISNEARAKVAEKTQEYDDLEEHFDAIWDSFAAEGDRSRWRIATLEELHNSKNAHNDMRYYRKLEPPIQSFTQGRQPAELVQGEKAQNQEALRTAMMLGIYQYWWRKSLASTYAMNGGGSWWAKAVRELQSSGELSDDGNDLPEAASPQDTFRFPRWATPTPSWSSPPDVSGITLRTGPQFMSVEMDSDVPGFHKNHLFFRFNADAANAISALANLLREEPEDVAQLDNQEQPSVRRSIKPFTSSAFFHSKPLALENLSIGSSTGGAPFPAGTDRLYVEFRAIWVLRMLEEVIAATRAMSPMDCAIQ